MAGVRADLRAGRNGDGLRPGRKRRRPMPKLRTDRVKANDGVL